MIEGPISHRGLDSLQRPSPAFTPAQRLHLDLYGYVVIENTLSSAEVDELGSTLYALEEAHLAGSLDGIAPAFVSVATPGIFRIDNLPHLAPSFFDYVTHPRLLGMVDEAIGGSARLEQSDAHIRRPGGDNEAYGFHRGAHSGLGRIGRGLYHFPFVKTLTNLTDLGPADGGTAVIPGSHKLSDEVDVDKIISAAHEDQSLIQHVEAPAGSTLVFFESLLHSGGLIRSGRDRLLIIGGYTSPMFQAWTGYDPSPDLMERLPVDYRAFFEGADRWEWTPNDLPLDVRPEGS